MYIFGVDVPLIEALFVFMILILVLAILLVIAYLKERRLRRRLENLNKNELIELERLRHLDDEMLRLSEQQQKDAEAFDSFKVALGHLMELEHEELHELKSVQALEKLLLLKGKKRRRKKPKKKPPVKPRKKTRKKPMKVTVTVAGAGVKQKKTVKVPRKPVKVVRKPKSHAKKVTHKPRHAKKVKKVKKSAKKKPKKKPMTVTVEV